MEKNVLEVSFLAAISAELGACDTVGRPQAPDLWQSSDSQPSLHNGHRTRADMASGESVAPGLCSPVF